MKHSASKAGRILTLYEDLRAGHVVNKAHAALRFGVDQRSIQRDIDELRGFLSEEAARSGDSRSILYDRVQKGFVLVGRESSMLTNSEILAVSKVLLESRAFPRKEMSRLLDKLVSGCVPQENMKLVSDLIANEKFHYVELTHPVPIQDQLWEIGLAIRHQEVLELLYQRQDAAQAPVKRVVEPVSLLFSEYYFYLNAFIAEADDQGQLRRKYDYPAIFRLDRILSCKALGQKFRQPYADRFQEGEFRKRVQFMYPGDLISLRLRYTGANPEAVLDRLPTARITSRDGGGVVMQGQVYGKGVLMWLMSQGSQVEILSPPSLRREMADALERTLALYQAD